ncbi:hypothetical protein AVEN_171696-1 [Araneus ventricosus]|uniref:Uncharacterized protein n=1 Tax=Araneus ventricosus TaxID=182803 RepID=A0A4Y2T8K2_ARAVE|nr:hypothetical protein AVEN_171696-1 [Araneus ventricosus]
MSGTREMKWLTPCQDCHHHSRTLHPSCPSSDIRRREKQSARLLDDGIKLYDRFSFQEVEEATTHSEVHLTDKIAYVEAQGVEGR